MFFAFPFTEKQPAFKCSWNKALIFQIFTKWPCNGMVHLENFLLKNNNTYPSMAGFFITISLVVLNKTTHSSPITFTAGCATTLRAGGGGVGASPESRSSSISTPQGFWAVFDNQEIRSNFFFMINTYLRTLEAISRACSGYPKGGSVLKVLS